MYVMTEKERAHREVMKALHKAIREDLSEGPRYRNLAWGYIRGLKYRRIERSHRLQELTPGYFSQAWYERNIDAGLHYLRLNGKSYYQHNAPLAWRLLKLLAKHIPDLAQELEGGDRYHLKKDSIVLAWLKDPEGAIPAPAPRPKKVWTPEQAASAAE